MNHSSLPRIHKSAVNEVEPDSIDALIKSIRQEKGNQTRALSVVKDQFFLPYVKERDGMGRIINAKTAPKINIGSPLRRKLNRSIDEKIN